MTPLTSTFDPMQSIGTQKVTVSTLFNSTTITQPIQSKQSPITQIEPKSPLPPNSPKTQQQSNKSAITQSPITHIKDEPNALKVKSESNEPVVVVPLDRTSVEHPEIIDVQLFARSKKIAESLTESGFNPRLQYVHPTIT